MKNYLNRILDSQSNGAEIASLLAKLLNVEISNSSITKYIEHHPNYPSLLSISDTLRKYGIENLSIRLEPEKLSDVPTPFITQIRGERDHIDYFTIIKEIIAKTVCFYDPESHKWRYSSITEFLKISSRIVLLTEVATAAGEREYEKKIQLEKRQKLARSLVALSIPIFLFVAGFIDFLQNGNAVLLPLVFSVFTIAGAMVGALLIWYDIDKYNPFLLQVCSPGKKVNCSAILESKGASIAGISWSRIGFSYFVGQLLFMIFRGFSDPSTLFLLAWLNLLALPYTVYSVYYQWRVAKQWCLLYLWVQGLLLLQFVTAFVGNWHFESHWVALPPNTYLHLIVSLTLPFLVMTILHPALQKSKEKNIVNGRLQKLKHDAKVFETLLGQQRTIKNAPEGLGIIMGNPDAAYKIIKVCNPYCGPCAKAHLPMEELLHNNPDVQLQIIFTPKNNDPYAAVKPVRHLMAIAEINDAVKTKAALDNWYLPEEKNYERFAEKYPMNGELKKQGDKLDAMGDWCNEAGIKHTPTFFIAIPSQGQKAKTYFELPSAYEVDDLKYILSV